MTKRTLTEMEREILFYVEQEWRSFKDILWDINGPRERTVALNTVRSALDKLTRKKIVERKRGRAPYTVQFRGDVSGFAGQFDLYRRRTA